MPQSINALHEEPGLETSDCLRPAVTLLVRLPPRRAQFLGNLRAAFGPGAEPLPFERQSGGIPAREICASTGVHILILTVLLAVLPRLRPLQAVVIEEKPRDYAVVYFPVSSLPQMEDSGASAGGAAGAAGGGQEFFHPTQTIRIARGPEPRRTIADVAAIALPQVKGPAANLLAILASPTPVKPALVPPVEVKTSSASRIPQRRTEPEALLPQLTAGTMPNIAPPPVPAVAKAAPRAEVVLPPSPRAMTPKQHKIEVADAPAPDLALLPVSPLPGAAPTSVNEGNVQAPQAVIVSVNPGNAIGVPADGARGSLAMSPKGQMEAGPGGKGSHEGAADGSGAGSTPASSAEGPGSGKAGSGSGANPAVPGGITPGAGSAATGGAGGAGHGASGIPGVTIRGGVITLDSFGPKAVPGQKPPEAKTPPRKAAPLVVVATSRSGGGLNAYGTFKSQYVYTVYVDTTASPVVVQFAARDATAEYNGQLTPPDPLKTELPALPAGTGVVLSCVLDASGLLQNVRVVKGASRFSEALVQAVSRWRFHPVLRAGQPVAVDVLLGFGNGVR